MQHQIAQQLYPLLHQMLPDGASLTMLDVEKLIHPPKIENSGFDYTLSCGPLSKIFKVPPQNLAILLSQTLHKTGMKAPLKNAVADKIFVNFTLDQSLMVRDILNPIRQQGENYGKTTSGQGKILCIEYSSPNIAKHFAVYHLITTLLGHVLGNLYESRGWKVIRLNHIGDWGTNIGYLISAIQHEIGKEQFLKLYQTLSAEDFLQRMQDEYVAINAKTKEFDLKQLQSQFEKYPNLLQRIQSGEPLEDILEDLKHSDPETFQRFNQDYSKLKQIQPNPYREQARATFVALEKKDPEVWDLYEKIKQCSLDVFHVLYKRLGISFDSLYGEAFYIDKMMRYLQEFEKRGVIEDSRGAKVITLNDLPKNYRVDVPCMLLKSDGGTTYLLRDLAALLYRKETYHFDRLLYVVASQQILHFKQLFGAVRKAKFEWIDQVEHLPFGMMTIDGRIGSTRRGNVVSAEDLLFAVENRVREIMQQNNLENEQWNRENQSDSKPVLSPAELELNAPRVALGAIIYQNIYTSRMKDKEFVLERALSFTGDSGPYLQMVVPKMNRILLKHEQRNKTPLPENPDYSLLSHPSEIQLISLLGEFSPTIDKTIQAHEPSLLTNYLIDLASAAHRFHHDCRVLQAETESLRDVRLVLTQAVSIVMSNALKLLGIPVPEKM